jgi:hypothetical protein
MRIDNLEDVKEFLEFHENDIEKKKSLYMKILANIKLKKQNPELNDYNLVKLNQIKEYMKLRTIFSLGWKTTNELNNSVEKSQENRRSENLEKMVSSFPLKILEQIANIDTTNSSKFNKDFLTNLIMAKQVDELNNDYLYGPEHFLSDISFFDKNNSQEYPSMPGYGGIKRRTYKKSSKRNYRLKKSKRNYRKKSKRTYKKKISKRTYKKY